MLIPSSDYTMTGIDWGNVNTRYVPYVLCLNTCHSDTSNTESRASIGLSYAAWTFDVGRPFGSQLASEASQTVVLMHIPSKSYCIYI